MLKWGYPGCLLPMWNDTDDGIPIDMSDGTMNARRLVNQKAMDVAQCWANENI